MKTYADFIEFDSVSGLKDFYEIPDALSQRQVALLNQVADEMDLRPSFIRTESGKRIQNPKQRVSEIGWLPNEQPHLWVYRKLGELTNIANTATWNFSLTGMTERVQLTQYDADNSGHFDWHIDLGAGALSKRKISMSILLSDPDDYDGGDLEFFTGKKNHLAGRNQGTAILFPSYLPHRVTPVTRGVRRSMIMWVSGPPFR